MKKQIGTIGMLMAIFFGIISQTVAYKPINPDSTAKAESKASFLNYVVTANDTILGDMLKIGHFNSSITSNNDELKVKTSEIVKYSMNGRIYEMMPTIINSKATSVKEMMELVKTAYNLRLYRWTHYDIGLQSDVTEYLVYDNSGKFIVNVNQQNKKSVLPFMGCYCNEKLTN